MKKLNFEQMEKIQGGLPCWAAKAALITAGIGFTFFTIGWGSLAIGALAVGFTSWDYLEACFPEMME